MVLQMPSKYFEKPIINNICRIEIIAPEQEAALPCVSCNSETQKHMNACGTPVAKLYNHENDSVVKDEICRPIHLYPP